MPVTSPCEPSTVFLMLMLYISYIYLFGPAEAYLFSMSSRTTPLLFLR